MIYSHESFTETELENDCIQKIIAQLNRHLTNPALHHQNSKYTRMKALLEQMHISEKRAA